MIRRCGYYAAAIAGLLTVLAVPAVFFLRGPGEAAAVGVMLTAGMIFGLSVVALVVAGERTSTP